MKPDRHNHTADALTMNTSPVFILTLALLLTGCATTPHDRETAEANAYVAGMVTGAVIAHNLRDDGPPHSLRKARRELRATRTLLWLTAIETLLGKP